MYVEIEHDFNKKFDTYIIAYCPDVDDFFVTNERAFYWEYDKEFPSEESAIDYFKKHLKEFLYVRNKMLSEFFYNYTPDNQIYLHNINTTFTIEEV